MEDTMRDLLSKLDALINETALRDKEDLEAKRQALGDLESDPVARKDPEISAAIAQRKIDLEKEAKAKGFEEAFELDREELKPAHDKGYSDASKGIEKSPFNPGSPADKAYREGQQAYKRHFGESMFEIGDDFGISFSEDFEIGSEIIDILEDGIVIGLDETAMEYLIQNGFTFEEVQIDEAKKKGLDGKACWKGYRYAGTKMKGGKRVDNCVKVGEELDEGVSYSTMDPKVAQMMLAAYKEASQGVEQYDDEEGANRIYDALKDVAKENNVLPQLKSLLNGASNAAHMDFDTNPGHFKNWFPYVGDYLEGLINRFKELGKLEDEPDFEVEKEDLEMEAKYQGREVPLGKPMKGDVKKSKVYVKGPKGNVVKVNFGDKKMRIKKSNPKRRKSFRARHNCSNPGPRWKARYWSCRAW